MTGSGEVSILHSFPAEGSYNLLISQIWGATCKFNCLWKAVQLKNSIQIGLKDIENPTNVWLTMGIGPRWGIIHAIPKQLILQVAPYSQTVFQV